jgi:hypothetical protein
MNDQHDDPKNQAPAWSASDREAAGTVASIDARITVFSIRALGYDPESQDPKPRELLDWVRRRQATERWWHQFLGAAITAAVTAVLGGVCWPLMQHILGLPGP